MKVLPNFLTPLIPFISATAIHPAVALASDGTSRQAECVALLEKSDTLKQQAICTALKNVDPPEAAKYVDTETGKFDMRAARADLGDPATAREYESAWLKAYGDAMAVIA